MVEWWQLGVIAGGFVALYAVFRIFIWYVSQFYGDL